VHRRGDSDITKVVDLAPGARSFNLVIKVCKITVLAPDGMMGKDKKGVKKGAASMRVAEAIVGDESGVIHMRCTNEQVNTLKRGAAFLITNGFISMFHGHMRLEVDRSGKIEELLHVGDWKPRHHMDVSATEYELATV